MHNLPCQLCASIPSMQPITDSHVLDPEVIFKSVQFLGRTLPLTSLPTFDSKTWSPIRLKSHDTQESECQTVSLNMTFDHQQLCDIETQSISRSKNKPSGCLLFTKITNKTTKKSELCHTFLVSHKRSEFRAVERCACMCLYNVSRYCSEWSDTRL